MLERSLSNSTKDGAALPKGKSALKIQSLSPTLLTFVSRTLCLIKMVCIVWNLVRKLFLVWHWSVLFGAQLEPVNAAEETKLCRILSQDIF